MTEQQAAELIDLVNTNNTITFIFSIVVIILLFMILVNEDRR